MPVTKTAKRALRVSKRKKTVNDSFRSRLEIAIRLAKKDPNQKNLKAAISLIDRGAKKNLFHKNKAGRMKQQLAKLATTPKTPKKAAPKKKK